MKLGKKLICLLLCFAMLVTTLTCVAAAKKQDAVYTASTVQEALDLIAQQDVDHDCKTKCHGNCGYSPVIIVPGIMQSQVYVQNKEGTGDLMTVDGFPIVEGMDMAFMFDTQSVKQDVKKMIFPLLTAFLFGRKAQFIDLVCEILDKCFYSHYFNEDGTRVYPAQVDEYWYSLEECKNHPEKSYNYAKGYSTDKNGNTLLHAALMRAAFDNIRSVLEPDNGNPAFSLYVYLIGKGCDPEVKNKRGVSCRGLLSLLQNKVRSDLL